MGKYMVLLLITLTACTVSKEERVKRYYGAYLDTADHWCTMLRTVKDEHSAKLAAKEMPMVWGEMTNVLDLYQAMVGELSEGELNRILPMQTRNDVETVDYCTTYNTYRIRDMKLDSRLTHTLLDIGVAGDIQERKELATYLKGL